MAIELINTILGAAIAGAAYDLLRRLVNTIKIKPASAEQLVALADRVETNERAFKATLIDWKFRFDELDRKVTSLPGEVQSKVAGTVAAIGAMPSVPKQWR